MSLKLSLNAVTWELWLCGDGKPQRYVNITIINSNKFLLYPLNLEDKYFAKLLKVLKYKEYLPVYAGKCLACLQCSY